MAAIREAIERHIAITSGVGEVTPWAWHRALLGPPTHTAGIGAKTLWHVWELPEPGWMLWCRLWVPSYASPWLEVQLKDSSPQNAAYAIRVYWEALGIGTWNQLVTLTGDLPSMSLVARLSSCVEGVTTPTTG